MASFPKFGSLLGNTGGYIGGGTSAVPQTRQHYTATTQQVSSGLAGYGNQATQIIPAPVRVTVRDYDLLDRTIRIKVEIAFDHGVKSVIELSGPYSLGWFQEDDFPHNSYGLEGAMQVLAWADSHDLRYDPAVRETIELEYMSNKIR